VDPITIGLAFATAQSAVSHIKQAIALGKDINSLYGQFSKFFESSDAIHREKIKQKATKVNPDQMDMFGSAQENEEYDTNGNLRVHHIWTFLPSDLKQTMKIKDVHHVELTPLYKDLTHKKNSYTHAKKYFKI
jgi:hypothetical protein